MRSRESWSSWEINTPLQASDRQIKKKTPLLPPWDIRADGSDHDIVPAGTLEQGSYPRPRGWLSCDEIRRKKSVDFKKITPLAGGHHSACHLSDQSAGGHVGRSLEGSLSLSLSLLVPQVVLAAAMGRFCVLSGASFCFVGGAVVVAPVFSDEDDRGSEEGTSADDDDEGGR